MALTAKLVMRQGQSLVMTPQLLQAIKLLQFSNLDLTAFIEEELERNPLLERAEDSPEPPSLEGACLDGGIDPAAISPGEEFNEASEADWSSPFLTTNREAIEASLGTELSNSFDDGRTTAPGEYGMGAGGLGLSATSWSGPSGGTGDGAAANLEAYVAAPANLKDHLEMQLGLATAGAADRMTGQVLIELDRRERLFHWFARRDRRASSCAGGTGRTYPPPHPRVRSFRRWRPRSRRMPRHPIA